MKVLIYQIGSLGDTLVSIPAYRAIRRHFGPDANICVLHNVPSDVRATPQQVLVGSGLVDDYLGFRQYGGRSNLRTLLQLWPQVVARRFDAAVYVGPGERSAASVRRDETFFRLCGIRRLFGFHACSPELFSARDAAGRPAPVPHEATMRLDRLRKDEVGVDETLDLQAPLLRLPATEIAAAVQWLGSRRQAPERPLVAICPGANQPAKFWRIERFAEIGRRLIEIGFEPVVIGGPFEKKWGDELVDGWAMGVNAAGELSVTGSAAALSQCAFLIGLDTGTTHLAASMGLPCVAIYADRDPEGQWTPLGDRHEVLIHQVPCCGCGLKECSVADHPCMTLITVERVWDACRRVVERLESQGLIGVAQKTEA